MRFSAFMNTLVPAAFGLGLIAFGILAFLRLGDSQRRLESKLQSIRTGEVRPETLTVVRKYLDTGKGAWPHVVFQSGRQPSVNLPVTRDFFNSVNPGQAIPAYYFPDGFFLPQNHREDSGIGRWFLLAIGASLGAVVLAVALRKPRPRPRIPA
jgi:hypothetical protein